jgi:hypothetical protein
MSLVGSLLSVGARGATLPVQGAVVVVDAGFALERRTRAALTPAARRLMLDALDALLASDAIDRGSPRPHGRRRCTRIGRRSQRPARLTRAAPACLAPDLAVFPLSAQHGGAQITLAHKRDRCIGELVRSEGRRLLRGDEQHHKAGVSVRQQPRRLDPAASRHAYVHQHELGRQRIRRGQSILAACSFAHHRETRRRTHEFAEHATKELLVIYDQHAHIGAAVGDGLVPFLG